MYLRQSTGGQVVSIGPFLDSTNGDDEETGLTIAAADILLWKKGATSLVAKSSGGATHMSRGVYHMTLSVADTDTIGPLYIYVHVGGALYYRLVEMVMHPDLHDAWEAGDLGNLAELFWTYSDRTLTQSLEIISAILRGTGILEFRGTKWDISATVHRDITDFDEIYFSVKGREEHFDNMALVRISLGSGLEWINKSEIGAGEDVDGSITVVDAATGQLNIILKAVQSAKLAPGAYHYDIKAIDPDADDNVEVLAKGKFTLEADITRAIA